VRLAPSPRPRRWAVDRGRSSARALPLRPEGSQRAQGSRVRLAVGPLPEQGLEDPFGIAVGLWSERPGRLVASSEPGDRVAVREGPKAPPLSVRTRSILVPSLAIATVAVSRGGRCRGGERAAERLRGLINGEGGTAPRSHRRLARRPTDYGASRSLTDRPAPSRSRSRAVPRTGGQILAAHWRLTPHGLRNASDYRRDVRLTHPGFEGDPAFGHAQPLASGVTGKAPDSGSGAAQERRCPVVGTLDRD
jgi:hypothetical protein